MAELTNKGKWEKQWYVAFGAICFSVWDKHFLKYDEGTLLECRFYLTKRFKAKKTNSVLAKLS